MTGLIITLAQQKGGSGKTTLAAHVAVALALGGRRVAVLDVDPQGSLGAWLAARAGAGRHARAPLTARTAAGWGARLEARTLARDHDAVIVDTPPKAGLESRPAINAADLVVVPVQPGLMDCWAMAPTLRLVGEEGGRAVLTVNRALARSRLTEETRAQIAADGLAATAAMLGNRVAFAVAMGRGLTVLETAPSGRAAREARDLAAEIVGMAGGQPR